jgi:Periplasmic copper-binding protein (NosD)/Abnormal spindle-like microcephaly-assoc'd, ASPM-SPD-2-Hydin
MSIRAIFVTLVSTCLLFSLPAMGKVIHVPADQPTIQAGITAAATGDTVLVSAGTYYENINFNGKAITVTSASGPAATVIDGSKGTSGITVNFSTRETASSVLNGFTIQNGSSTGINISSASPTISANVLILNGVSLYGCGGTAISVYSGAPSIQGNLISGNGSSYCGAYGAINTSSDTGIQILGNVISSNYGNGIELSPSSGTTRVNQNTITQNHGYGLLTYNGGGTALVVQNLISGNSNSGFSFYYPAVTAISNTITNNTVQCCSNSGSEISANSVSSTTVLENNLLAAVGDAPAFYCGSAASVPTMDNNDVFALNSAAYGGACQDQTGSNGNISSDPLFVDLLGDNFHIQSGSPAVNAGTNSAPDEPSTDMDGDARTIGGTIDIGADEYSPDTALTLSTLGLHFQAQDVGSISAAQTVTLTNETAQAVSVNLIATGTSYSQTNNCGTSLAAGAGCQINVSFAPLGGGTIDGALGVFTNATTNPLVVTLVGTGLAPQIELPCCFYFYNQVIGTSATNTGSVTNDGQAPLTITSIVYTGPSDFVETNNCPIAPNTLAVGASCTLSITFTPTIVGYESGSVAFTDNAPGSPQSISFSGSSVSAGIPTLNPTSLTFPTTLIGQSSAPQSAILTNTGTGPLGITNIYSYGDFPETNNCPSSLAAGASCTITVTFTPSNSGTEDGTVYIYTDSSYFAVYLNTSGTGQAPVPTLSSLSLTSTPAGSGDQQVTATGTGFVYGSQVLWNGIALNNSGTYGNTQIDFTIPAADLITPGTYQISIFTPTPGGGVSNTLPFVVYQPINYAAKSTKYDYKTITGTNLDLSYYNYAQIVSPFPIQFGGGSYSTLTIGSSGTISFNDFFSYYNSPIPDSYTITLVAPFWDTLYSFGGGTDNNVFWEVLGSEPNRQLVVEWRDVGYCCETTGLVTFEVVLFEGSSEVEFNYADTVFGGGYSSHDNGATASVGMQVSSNLGTQYSYDQASVKSNTTLLWYPSSPTVTVSTSSLSFGYHQIGSKSRAQKLTVTNGGNVPVTISSVTVDNGDFQLVNKCGTTLNPHKSCSMHLFFDPSVPVAETATLSISDNAPNSPQTVALSGTGSVTPILVYPILANFGNVPVGQTATVPVVLANAANKPLTIQGITAAPSVYTETDNCGTSLAAGASCTVNVSFAPVQQGNVSGKLSMALDGKPAVNEAKLVGSGK